MQQAFWTHDLDPVLVSIGPFDLRWYALAYIVGLIAGWRWGMKLAARSPLPIEPDHIDRFLTWAVLGVIVGGRLGNVIFYHPGQYLADPISILKVWEGGMSFHGGLLGVMVAMILFARNNKIPLFSLTDIICAVAPFGIFLGRIANFINGEHWGRVAEVPWAIAFPKAMDLLPRHPSQLYEAGMEGVLLLIAVTLAVRKFNGLARPGLVSGVFLVGYAIARSVGELFREPEVLMQTLPFGTTWGQWLSLPMFLGGVWLIAQALRKPPVPMPKPTKTPKKKQAA